VFWRFGLISASDPFHPLPEILRIFGVCASAAMALSAYLELAKRPVSRDRALTYVTGLLVASYFLHMIVTDTLRTYDYLCYESAGRALIKGQNPYPSGFVYPAFVGGYIYPPIMAQAMAAAARFCGWFAALLKMNLPDDARWTAVFYLYQCGQFLLAVLGYILCYRMGRLAGLQRIWAAALAAAVLVFNNSVYRTVQEKQVNLLVMDAVLAVLLFTWRYPLAGGWAIALGSCIKIYPAVLVFPAVVARRYKAAAGLVTGGICIFVAGFFLDGGAGVWLQFAAMARSFPKQPNLGNISLNETAQTLLGFAGNSDRLPLIQTVMTVIIPAAKAGVIAWIAARIWKRSAGAADDSSRREAFYENCMDVVAGSLLIAPVLWDHHFVILIPFAIWTLVKRAPAQPWAIGAGVFLMLGFSNMEIFPLYSLRVLGLILLLWHTAPGKNAEPLSSAVPASLPLR
jgi:hypothetical protein